MTDRPQGELMMYGGYELWLTPRAIYVFAQGGDCVGEFQSITAARNWIRALRRITRVA